MVQNKETNKNNKNKTAPMVQISTLKQWKTELVPPNLYHPRVKAAGKHHSAILKVNKTALLFSPRLRKIGTPYKMPTPCVTKKC